MPSAISRIGMNPERRFILVVSTLVGVFMLVYREDVIGAAIGPWVDLTARLTLAALQDLGLEAARVGTRIHHPSGFAYEIYYRCTGILPAAMLMALILATAAPLWTKGLGLAAGIPLLIILNLVRLVHLFHIGVHHPALFAPAHEVLWELLLILATLGLWRSWSRWVKRLKCSEVVHDPGRGHEATYGEGERV